VCFIFVYVIVQRVFILITGRVPRWQQGMYLRCSRRCSLGSCRIKSSVTSYMFSEIVTYCASMWLYQWGNYLGKLPPSPHFVVLEIIHNNVHLHCDALFPAERKERLCTFDKVFFKQALLKTFLLDSSSILTFSKASVSWCTIYSCLSKTLKLLSLPICDEFCF
jgi:hypothetical protein